MAIINSYPIGTPKSNDLIAGTSMPNVNTDADPITKNFTVQSIIDLTGITAGTDNTLSMFGPGSTLVDSPLRITSGNVLNIETSNTIVDGTLTVGGVISGNLTGDVTGNLTGNVIGNVTGNLTGDVTGNLTGNVTGGTVNATQVVIEGNTAPLVLKKNSTTNSHIKMESTDGNGFISSRNSHIGIGGTNGYSTNNINVNKSNGYLGVQQKNPLAPLHVKRNGEAIRLEGSGDNITSIDFRQGTIKRGHIEFDNSNDTIEIKTTNPTGSASKIKFSTASGVGQEGTEVMRVQKNQVVIGNPVSAPSSRELYINGAIETTGALNVFLGSLSVDGRVDADIYKLKGLNTAPPSSGSPGGVGEIRFTAGYIYVCIAPNQWRRATLADW